MERGHGSANNAVTSITHKNPNGTQIVQHSYTYDNTNNIVEYLNSIDGQTTYNYDFLGQLIGADYANQNLTDETYTYDENGNRVTANGDTYTTGDNNELTSDGTWTYTYDAEGNRISKTNAANTERELYTWDYRNRLTTVTKQTYDTLTNEWTTVQIVEYAYDYNNIWIRKTIGNSKTIFIPENYQTTVQIDNGTTTHHCLWTPNQQDKLLADTTTSGILWALTDHLGTIRDVLDGNSSTHLIYDAFGNLTSGTNPILFGYTGKAFDADTALQNNINRWYDATIGRWLSTDPIGFNGGDANLFRYVNNCVVFQLDYWGYEKFDPSILIGGNDSKDDYNFVKELFDLEYIPQVLTANSLSFDQKRMIITNNMMAIIYSIEDIQKDCQSKQRCLTIQKLKTIILNLPYVETVKGTIQILNGDISGAKEYIPPVVGTVSQTASALFEIYSFYSTLKDLQEISNKAIDVKSTCERILDYLYKELERFQYARKELAKGRL